MLVGLLVVVGACGEATTGRDARVSVAPDSAGVVDLGVGQPDLAKDSPVAVVDAPGPWPLDAAVKPNSGVDAPALDTSVDRGIAAEVPAPTSQAWSMGYYAGYDVTRLAVNDIAWAGLTHVAAAFYFPKADGSIDESFYQGSVAAGRKLGQDLVAAAHANGRKAVASLGGAASQASFKTSVAGTTRDTFVQAIVRLAADYGYDGIDFDWEPLPATDEPLLLDLATRVRAANPALLLTVPVGWVNANVKTSLTGYGALAKVVDQINIMTYGAAGAWSGWKSWHSSALYQTDSATPSSVDSSVRAYLAAGVPKEKLGFGIGFYGLCYTFPITGPLQTLSATATLGSGDGAMAFATIRQTYTTPAARRWDAVARVPYLSFAAETGPKGCGYISYDDEQSIAEKAAYLKAQGLGGVIIWEINEGHLSSEPEGQRDPLMDALAKLVLGE